jgi:acetyl-CoA synthetase
MLGNQVELWDLMLAVMKLGAVIMPTTTAAGTSDLEDRIDRGRAKAVVTNPDQTWKFDEHRPDYPDQRRRGRRLGGSARGIRHRRGAPDPAPGHRARRPAAALLHLRHHQPPKLVEHTQVSYPGRAPVDDVLARPAPGDVHLNISSPGLGQACVVVLLRAVDRRGDGLPLQLHALRRPRRCWPAAHNEVTTFCAPPTVWRMLINADLSGGKGSLREVIGAGEPLNPEVIDQVDAAWGLTLRDGYGQTEMTAASRQCARVAGQGRVDGSPLPGMPVVLVDPLTGERRRGDGEGEICLDLSAARPLG